MKDSQGGLLDWLHDRDVLVRRFVLAEVLGPPRAAAWAYPGATRAWGAGPAGIDKPPDRADPDPSGGGAPPPK